jgi:acyl carrier protein
MPNGNSLIANPNEQKVIEILQKSIQFYESGRSFEAMRYDTLIADLAIDSLLLSELIFDLEDNFEVQLSDDEMMDLTSSDTIGQFIEIFLGCCGRSTGQFAGSQEQ